MSVGVKSEAYGALLSILRSKLPTELKLIVGHQVWEEEEWKLDSLMEVIESEIQARKCSSMENRQGCSPTREHSTGATLLTGGSTLLSCCFCKQEYLLHNCTNVANVAAQKQPLRRSGWCCICLRRNHTVRKYRSKLKCTKCDGKTPCCFLSSR